MDKLSCGIVWDLLPLYCDGVCGEESRAAVAAHLKECPHCEERYMALKEELPAAREEELEARGALLEFGSFLKGEERRSRRRGLRAGLLVALLMAAVAFYLLPLLIRDTGSGMFVLLLLIPVLCVGGGFVCGFLSGFQWVYPLLTAVLFLPAVLLYFNDSALVYAAVYGVIALVGDGLGGLLHYFLKR